jgi:hypothetical protein
MQARIFSIIAPESSAPSVRICVPASSMGSLQGFTADLVSLFPIWPAKFPLLVEFVSFVMFAKGTLLLLFLGDILRNRPLEPREIK